MNTDLQALADDDFCYLTTIGRRSGRPHTIEIWFALDGRTLYLLSGGGDKADWVKNLQQHPSVQVRIRQQEFSGQARLITAGQEDALARKLLYEKYTPRSSDDLSDWSQASLPVAVSQGFSPLEKRASRSGHRSSQGRGSVPTSRRPSRLICTPSSRGRIPYDTLSQQVVCQLPYDLAAFPRMRDQGPITRSVIVVTFAR